MGSMRHFSLVKILTPFNVLAGDKGEDNYHCNAGDTFKFIWSHVI